MSSINILNSKFENASTLETQVKLDADVISVATVHQVVKANLASKRQGTASTKNRSLVSGGGKKPFKQKGTGNARQGSKRSPLMVGGGVVFGPTPRSYKQKVNKKIMLKAIQSIIADKFQAGKLTVIETIESTGKTKEMFQTLSSKNLLPALVVTNNKDSKAILATNNIRNAKAVSVEHFNVYDAVRYENLIIEREALESLLNRLV